MEKVGFNLASWSHWLLVVCFVGVSAWGLMLSWQWGEKDRTRRQRNKRRRAERKQIELSRRLAMDSLVATSSQNANPLPLRALQLSKREEN